MTKKIEQRKYNLIRAIIELKDDKTISKLEQHMKQILPDNSFLTAIKPIRKNVTINDLIKEQNYKPLTRKDFFEKASKLNIQESFEELNSMLSK